MNTNEDPRVTAYALGEMNDADRTAFEAELAADPAAKEAADVEVASIRSTAATLTQQLRDEANVAWATSPSSLGDGLVARATKKPRRSTRWVLAAAAAVVVGGLAFSISLPSLNRARETAGPLRMLGTSVSLSQNENRGSFPTKGSELAAGDRLRAIQDQESVPSIAVAAKPLPGAAKDKAAGQNIQYGDRHVEYVKNPFVGVQRDNIFTGRNGPQQQGKQQVAAQSQNVAMSETPLEPGLVAADANDAVLLPAGEAERSLARKDAYGRRLHEEPNVSAESYAKIYDNTFLDPHAAPLSTFGVDVDTASYANVRRYLEAGQRPPADAVRIEELINYFPTHDAPPTDGRPFAVKMEVAACPWSPGHRLVRVALKGQVVAKEARPPSNLVFLVDVSGSMSDENKLPLVKRSLRKLVGQLGENDRVAIAVYAGNSGLALPSTSASDKTTILKAIDNLEAGGSTNGAQGIQLAYATAMEHLVKDAGSNRVILCTDGDFNVGITDRTQLFNLIAEKAKAGVFLNVLGFGTGNTKDDTMEGLADKGNGQYGYIDSDREADKVFVEGLAGTLQTIAKDVKLQLEFNPGTVKSYRLIGYESRVMAAQDFNNDLKDSGDLGAGHNVVALYEIEPAGSGRINEPVNGPLLKYQPQTKPEAPAFNANANSTELLTLKLRYKRPDAPLEQGTSELIETTLNDRADASIGDASEDLRFAAAVAGFGMLLRDSPYRGATSWELVRSLARDSIGDDVEGHRSEFLNLIDAAQKARP